MQLRAAVTYAPLHIAGELRKTADTLDSFGSGFESEEPSSRAALEGSLDEILDSVSTVTSDDLRGCRKLDLLLNIGAMYESMGMFEDAFDCYLGALTTSRSELPALDKAQIELKAGRMLCGLAEWPEAEKCLHSALETFKSAGEKSGAVKALTLLGKASYQQGRHHKAVKILNEGVAIAKALGDEKALADLSVIIGLAFALASEYGNSLCSLQDALVYYQRTYDFRGVAEVYHNMARVHVRQNRIRDAASCCDKSLIMCEKISDHSLFPFVLLTKAEISWESGDYPACASFCRRGTELLAGWGGPIALAKVNRILGDLIARVVNWESAEPFYEHSRDLYGSHGVKAGEAWAYVASARRLEEEGRGGEGVAHLAKALAIYRELELDRDAERTARRISAIRGLVPAE